MNDATRVWSDASIGEWMNDATRMGRTTISCSEELADELYQRKRRGESYEDVIWRLIREADGDSVDEPEPEPTREPTDDVALTPESVADSVEKSMTDIQRRSLIAALEYLRKQGTAEAGDIVAAAYEAEPDSYASEASWRSNLWNNVGGDLRETGAVELVSKPQGRWKWVG